MDLSEAKHISSLQERHPWERARVKVIKSLIGEFYPDFFRRECICFDIGCGDTFLVEQLSSAFPKSFFYAIDIGFDEKTLSEYRQKYKNTNIRVFKSKEEAEASINAEIDVVLLLDVLEHIEDDTLFLNEICSDNFTNKETYFFITVPAFQSLFSSHDEILNHYRRYNNRELLRITKYAGLRPIAAGYFFLLLLFFRIPELIIEKIFKQKKTQTQLNGWNAGLLTNNILTAILIFDFKVTFTLKKIGLKIPGLSNYIICKKSV